MFANRVFTNSNIIIQMYLSNMAYQIITYYILWQMVIQLNGLYIFIDVKYHQDHYL